MAWITPDSPVTEEDPIPHFISKAS